jgi:hypothetical protein
VLPLSLVKLDTNTRGNGLNFAKKRSDSPLCGASVIAADTTTLPDTVVPLAGEATPTDGGGSGQELLTVTVTVLLKYWFEALSAAIAQS